jgi:serine/threonine-protein kinase HipA
MIDRLHICVDDGRGDPLPVGDAFFTARAGKLVSSTFHYSTDYLASQVAFPIDPALGLFTGPQNVSGLPGALQDCSPDRWGRNLIVKRARAERSAVTLTDVDFLAGVSDVTRQGALRIRADARTEFLAPGAAVPKLIELPRLLRAADLASRYDDLAAIKALLDAGTGSLGGARPKAAVRDGSRLFIAKFSHADDQWDVMAWEKTAIDLAAAAGIHVPPNRLTRIQNRAVLLLERFDRDGAGRVPYISAMTLLEAKDGDARDYTEVAEALADIGAQTTEDLRELWRRVAFSLLINNTDDHLRNHGFLRTGGGWRLSPAFDMNPNPDPTVSRQTGIGGSYDWAGGIESLLDYADTFRLERAEASQVLAEIADAVANWRNAAAANGILALEVARFSDAFRSP